MSFSPGSFYLDRGSFNSAVQQITFAIHRYFSSDTQGEVESFGYFPPFFGYDVLTVREKDHVYVQLENGFSTEYLISFDDFGNVILQQIHSGYASETLTIETGVEGVVTEPNTTVAFCLTKQANIVLLFIPFAELFVTEVDAALSFSQKIPTEFLPFNDFSFNFSLLVLNEESFVQGRLNISPSGRISIGIYTPASPFPARFTAGFLGWWDTNVTWSRIVN